MALSLSCTSTLGEFCVRPGRVTFTLAWWPLQPLPPSHSAKPHGRLPLSFDRVLNASIHPLVATFFNMKPVSAAPRPLLSLLGLRRKSKASDSAALPPLHTCTPVPPPNTGATDQALHPHAPCSLHRGAGGPAVLQAQCVRPACVVQNSNTPRTPLPSLRAQSSSGGPVATPSCARRWRGRPRWL